MGPEQIPHLTHHSPDVVMTLQSLILATLESMRIGSLMPRLWSDNFSYFTNGWENRVDRTTRAYFSGRDPNYQTRPPGATGHRTSVVNPGHHAVLHNQLLFINMFIRLAGIDPADVSTAFIRALLIYKARENNKWRPTLYFF